MLKYGFFPLTGMTVNKLEVPKKVRSVAIIGGGASGAISLDSLIKEGAFEKITLFERRENLGGIWSYENEVKHVGIEPGSTAKELDPPITQSAVSTNQERFEGSPAYSTMRTNIPEQLMTFSDVKKWPWLDRPGSDTLTVAPAVRDYLVNYMSPYKSYIKQGTTVEKVSKNTEGKFVLSLRRRENDSDVWWDEQFDAIVVATGHYHVPMIPEIEGIKSLYREWPQKIVHAKYFRENTKGKTVIVVGTRSSGLEAASRVADDGGTVFLSRRSTGIDKRISRLSSILTIKPTIERFQITDEGFDVVFSDGSVVANPDRVVYATGYQFSFPFFDNLYPDFVDQAIVPHLYQHTFYIKDPLVCVVGVPIDGISFRVFEYQAIAVSRYLSGKIALPDAENQQQWLNKRYEKWGNSRRYHTLGADEALQYAQEITALGGGVTLGGPGRSFPVYSEDDVRLYYELVGKRFEE